MEIFVSTSNVDEGLALLKSAKLLSAAKRGDITRVAVGSFSGTKKVLIEYKTKGKASKIGLSSLSHPNMTPAQAVSIIKKTLRTLTK